MSFLAAFTSFAAPSSAEETPVTSVFEKVFPVVHSEEDEDEDAGEEEEEEDEDDDEDEDEPEDVRIQLTRSTPRFTRVRVMPNQSARTRPAAPAPSTTLRNARSALPVVMATRVRIALRNCAY